MKILKTLPTLEINIDGVIHKRVQTMDNSPCQNCSLFLLCDDLEKKSEDSIALCMIDDLSIISNEYHFEKKTNNTESVFLKAERLVLRRFEDIEELKTEVTSLLEMEVMSVSKDDMSNLDDKSTGFVQADFSMTLDINPNSEEHEYAMLTLYYYNDRQGNYVIIEVSFAFE